MNKHSNHIGWVFFGRVLTLVTPVLLLVAHSPAFAVIPVITSPELGNAEIGQNFQYQITTQLNNATSYEATNLPDGLSYSPTTGLIAGTPTFTQAIADLGMIERQVMLKATNSDGTGTLEITIRVHHRQSSVTLPPFPTNLESRPGAVGLIYLDFDGELLTSPEWNGGNPILLNPSGLNDTQVRQIFEAVKEDFRPFDVNVSTRRDLYDARDSAGPPYRRIRMIITPSDAWNPQVGADAVCEQGAFAEAGVAFVQNPPPAHIRDPRYSGLAFVRFFDIDGAIVQSPRDLASSISHELGHGFGMHHDGVDYNPYGENKAAEYFLGTGTGASHGPKGKVGGALKDLNVWTPLMGSNTFGFLTQWSKGDYYAYKPAGGFGNPQQPNLDDVDLVAGAVNGVGYAPDPEGDSLPAATVVSVSDTIVFDGTIGRASNGSPDIDVLKITLTQPAVLNFLASPREPLSDVFPDFDPLQKQELNFGITNLYMNVELLGSGGSDLIVFSKGSEIPVDPNNPNGLEPTEFFRRRLTNFHLGAGTYYLRISGIGRGDPFVAPEWETLEGGARVISNYPGYFSSYGSMGAYKIRGTIDYDPVIVSAFSTSGSVGNPFNHAIVATNNPTSYDASNLPPGLVINANTGLISGVPTSPGIYNAIVAARRNQAVGYQTLTITITGANVIGDALDAPYLNWTTPQGYFGWFRQTSVTHDLVDAAQCADIDDNQRAGMETQVTGPGTISFYWKVSSERRWDALRFEIDGIVQGDPISEEVPWTPASFPVGPGNHTLRWVYEKDPSLSVGADTAWVDEVVYVQFLPPVITSANSLIMEQGTPYTYQIVAVNSPTSFSEQSGHVPGMSVNQATGLYSGTPSVVGPYSVTFGASNTAGTGLLGVQVTVIPSIGEAVDNFVQTFSRSGAGNWFGQQGVYVIGGDAAQSAPITHNQTCTLETTVTGPLNLSFWWKTDCEAANDYLICRDNGAEIIGTGQGRISGNNNFTQVNVSIGSGSHTISWTYVKNGSISAGADAGWVDGIQFGPAVPVISSPSSISSVVGHVFSFLITASNSPTNYAIVGTMPPGTALSPDQPFIIGVPYQGGTWPVTLQVTNAAGATNQAFTFYIESSRSAWNRDNNLTGIHALPTYDTDGDGLPGLMEMALARNPHVRDDGYNPVSRDPATGKLRAIFRTNQRYRDITYWVDVSGDCVNWTPIFRYENVAGTNLGASSVNFTPINSFESDVEVIDSMAPAPGTRRFMLVRIVEH